MTIKLKSLIEAKQTPYLYTLKYPTTDAETGKPLKAGVRVIIDPGKKPHLRGYPKAYALNTNKAIQLKALLKRSTTKQ